MKRVQAASKWAAWVGTGLSALLGTGCFTWYKVLYLVQGALLGTGCFTWYKVLYLVQGLVLYWVGAGGCLGWYRA